MLKLVKTMNRKRVHLSNLAKSSATSLNHGTSSTVKNEEDPTVDAASTSGSVTSPYFSPRKSRNKIKIEYEASKKSVAVVSKKFQNDRAPGASSIKIEKHEAPLKSPKMEKKSKRDTTRTKISEVKSEHIDTQPIATVKKETNRETSTDEEGIVNVKSDPTDGKALKWEPKNWQQTLENLRLMRQGQLAPVDTMGCHRCGDDAPDEKTRRFHILIALMLSSQTKDQVTFDAMKRLKAHGLTPANVINTDTGTLEKLIYPVSFYKNKAKYILKASRMLVDECSSDIPSTYEGLVKLPGVGPKMAHICMNSAWNIVTGIGVDTHVHRISNRLRWLPKPTTNPEQTRMALEQWLPFDLWHETNELLVGFGQTICTPTYPKCDTCVNSDICPSKGTKK